MPAPVEAAPRPTRRIPSPAATGAAPPSGAVAAPRSTRHLVRLVVAIVVAGVAIHLLLPRIGQLRDSVYAIENARPGWLIAGFAFALASYPLSAVSLMGAVGERLPLGRTTLVELAAASASRLTPGGLGRPGLLTRYLSVAGKGRVQVAAIIGVNVVAGAVVHVAALAAVAAFARPIPIAPHRLPDRWTDLLGVVGVLAGVGLVVGAVVLRRRWRVLRQRLAAVRPHLVTVVTRPGPLSALVLGVVAVNAVMISALDLSLVAFGGHPAFVVVALVYLGGSAVASLAPTPGGLGAMEAALVAGLTGLGVAAGPAITGVLAYRLMSWWIPMPMGALAWTWLRRARIL